jgi:hypothetical protein
VVSDSSLSPILSSLLSDFESTSRIAPLLVSENDARSIITKILSLSPPDDLHEIADLRFAYFSPEKDTYSVEEALQIVERASYRAPEGSIQILCVGSFDTLSDRAANTLLKTLEEIQDNTLFLCIIKSRESLLDTISSRVIYISSDEVPSHISPKTRDMAEGIAARDPVSFKSFYSTKSFDRTSALELCFALVEVLKTSYQSYQGRSDRGHKVNIFELLSEVITNISSTNTSPRGQIDRVILALFSEK